MDNVSSDAVKCSLVASHILDKKTFFFHSNSGAAKKKEQNSSHTSDVFSACLILSLFLV